MILVGGGGADFVTKQFSEKAKHTEICPSFGGNMSEIQTRRCLLPTGGGEAGDRGS